MTEKTSQIVDLAEALKSEQALASGAKGTSADSEQSGASSANVRENLEVALKFVDALEDSGWTAGAAKHAAAEVRRLREQNDRLREWHAAEVAQHETTKAVATQAHSDLEREVYRLREDHEFDQKLLAHHAKRFDDADAEVVRLRAELQGRYEDVKVLGNSERAAYKITHEAVDANSELRIEIDRLRQELAAYAEVARLGPGVVAANEQLREENAGNRVEIERLTAEKASIAEIAREENARLKEEVELWKRNANIAYENNSVTPRYSTEAVDALLDVIANMKHASVLDMERAADAVRTSREPRL